MPLTDFTFRLGDAGVVLNDDAVGIPFVDLEKVSGLDNSPYRETARDHEGADGGFLDAEFEKGRDIVLEGMVFANVNTSEVFLDTLKANFAPVQAPIPLYFRGPGVDERLLFVKPRGCRYDWDTARRLGMTPIQFLMFAEDPRIYTSAEVSTVANYGGDTGLGLGFELRHFDTFTRNVTGGWGTSDSGHTYSLSGTAAHFTVNGTAGSIQLTDAVNSTYQAVMGGASGVQHELYLQNVALSATPTGGSITHFYNLRVVDASNYYRINVIFTTSNTVQVSIERVLAGVFSTIGSTTTIGGVTATTALNIRAQVTGTVAGGMSQQVRVWQSGTAEPSTWNLEAFDTTHTATGTASVNVVRNTGNTNVNPLLTISQLQWFGGIGFNINFGGGATPGGTTVTNQGNRNTPVTFIVQGPIENPLIFNTTTGHTMAFNIVLGASDTLTVNTRDRTVYLNGNINRRNTMTNADWFDLVPGANFIGFGGLTGAGSTLTIRFRSAWR